jgi:hypothetical protein
MPKKAYVPQDSASAQNDLSSSHGQDAPGYAIVDRFHVQKSI